MLAKALLCAVVLGAAFTYIGCAAPAETNDPDSMSSSDLAAAKAATSDFHDVPDMTDAERQAILDQYANIQHDGVRQELYEKAVLYYHTNYDVIPNKNYLSVVDFAKHSGKHRFFIMDLNGGAMSAHMVAHGRNSDPNDTGIPTSFSNTVGSLQSSLGYYLASETYVGVHGESVRLDGLSTTNSNVRDRVVVIHSAAYVLDDRSKQGMSEGCLAVPEDEKPTIVAQLKNGSVIYASN
jgi:hypothetical protein